MAADGPLEIVLDVTERESGYKVKIIPDSPAGTRSTEVRRTATSHASQGAGKGDGRADPTLARKCSLSETLASSTSTTLGAQSEMARHEKRRESGSEADNSSRSVFQRIFRPSLPPAHTHPLFPPLPQYGPPSLLRSLTSTAYRVSSFFLSLSFLGLIVVGSLVSNAPSTLRRAAARLSLRDPDAGRPFYAEEKRRKQMRLELERSWKQSRRAKKRSDRAAVQAQKTRDHASLPPLAAPREAAEAQEDPAGAGIGDSMYTPTEGGPDPLVCDVSYYARRVGLDVEEFQVQTEDGFVIDLWHVYDPAEHKPLPAEQRGPLGSSLLFDEFDAEGLQARQQQMFAERLEAGAKQPKYPVLLMHGLLQSAGAYCVNDEDSLAFYLCKAGYDVWLGNNRCGFRPRHVELAPSDPRMWCWNIRHMGVLDLPALVSRVLRQTGFARLGLVCHSQGTTETFVALAKEQRPALGDSISVFCALAPAAYAGPLISKAYFRFMRSISPAFFRVVFGIHSFIPLMMQMHPLVPGRLYGWLGYRVFSFLFDWSDVRWDRGLRDRMFQFAPVYISAESMGWWLGSRGFAHHKCILATREQWSEEEREEEASEREIKEEKASDRPGSHTHPTHGQPEQARHPQKHVPGRHAWYDERVPPFALWVCGRDDLVDGRRLLKRLLPAAAYSAVQDGGVVSYSSDTGARSRREPHVRVVHAKVLPEYEHLDVLWAMDAVDEIFCEIREVLWKTCPVRDGCRVPQGCASVTPWVDGDPDASSSSDSGSGSSSSSETSSP